MTQLEIELEILACSLNQMRHRMYSYLIPNYKGTIFLYPN